MMTSAVLWLALNIYHEARGGEMMTSAVLWLALNIYHEARGESERTRLAVAHVTINRAKENGEAVYKTVKKPHQFSWRLSRAKRNAKPWKEDPEVFLKCSITAVKAMHGRDFTKGATYFHEKKIRPRWAKKLKKAGKYGKLIFYKKKRART